MGVTRKTRYVAYQMNSANNKGRRHPGEIVIIKDWIIENLVAAVELRRTIQAERIRNDVRHMECGCSLPK